MISKGDPILDLHALCAIAPRSKAELEREFVALGWGMDINDVLPIAVGTYLTWDDCDKRYHPRPGTVREVVAKTLG